MVMGLPLAANSAAAQEDVGGWCLKLYMQRNRVFYPSWLLAPKPWTGLPPDACVQLLIVRLAVRH
jgi:hypothetical protein